MLWAKLFKWTNCTLKPCANILVWMHLITTDKSNCRRAPVTTVWHSRTPAFSKDVKTSSFTHTYWFYRQDRIFLTFSTDVLRSGGIICGYTNIQKEITRLRLIYIYIKELLYQPLAFIISEFWDSNVLCSNVLKVMWGSGGSMVRALGHRRQGYGFDTHVFVGHLTLTAPQAP